MEEHVNSSQEDPDHFYTYFFQEEPCPLLSGPTTYASSALAPLSVNRQRIIDHADLPSGEVFIPALNSSANPLPRDSYRTPRQRSLHNTNERHRTSIVRQRFDALRQVLPFDGRNPQPTRLNILDVAAKYITLLVTILRSEQSAQNIGTIYDRSGLRHTAVFIADHVRENNQKLLNEFYSWACSRQPKGRYDSHVSTHLITEHD